MEAVTLWLNSVPASGVEWLLALAFIVLDVIIGTCHAWATNTISSTKARQGIMHKMGYLGAMLLCTLIDIAQGYLNLGFSAPTLAVCSIMICLTEIFSICEHIEAMNPDINLRFLEQNKDKEEKEDTDARD